MNFTLENPEEKVSKEHALMEMNVIRTQLGQFGANDAEIPTIDRLIDAVHKGTITPENALAEARPLLSGKQGYFDAYR